MSTKKDKHLYRVAASRFDRKTYEGFFASLAQGKAAAEEELGMSGRWKKVAGVPVWCLTNKSTQSIATIRQVVLGSLF